MDGTTYGVIMRGHIDLDEELKEKAEPITLDTRTAYYVGETFVPCDASERN